jgi:hypothetical protein
MVRAQCDIAIHRPPEQVFRYFADLRNEPKWNRGHVRDVVMTTPEPIGPGTAFEGFHPGFGRATWRIVQFDPPSRIAIEGEVGSGTYRYHGQLSPQNSGTRFQGRVEWQPAGPIRILGPMLALLLRFQARRSFGNLRAELERAA